MKRYDNLSVLLAELAVAVEKHDGELYMEAEKKIQEYVHSEIEGTILQVFKKAEYLSMNDAARLYAALKKVLEIKSKI